MLKSKLLSFWNGMDLLVQVSFVICFLFCFVLFFKFWYFREKGKKVSKLTFRIPCRSKSFKRRSFHIWEKNEHFIFNLKYRHSPHIFIEESRSHLRSHLHICCIQKYTQRKRIVEVINSDIFLFHHFCHQQLLREKVFN